MYIYCDKKDPNMPTFLNPLIEKLNIPWIIAELMYQTVYMEI